MPTATPPGPPARITTGNAAPITNKAVAQQRDPHPAQPGAAVGELAVGAVDLAPLLGQVKDLLDLLVEQAVDCAAAGGPVHKRAGGPPGLPTVDPPLGDL
jgi:hypothetical protein